MLQVDLKFPARGDGVPVDHGYALFSALCRRAPALHDNPAVAVHPIGGTAIGGRRLRLGRHSAVTLRCAAEGIAPWLALAGQELALGPDKLRLGVPQVRALTPAASLYARLVVIKGFLEAGPFLEAARRQLAELGLGSASPELVSRAGSVSFEGKAGARSAELRRTLHIKGKTIVGFALRVCGLSAEESLILQEKGLGGRRRFGCGVFVPSKERHS